MNIINTANFTKHTFIIVSVILSVGVLSGCAYCQPLLLAAFSYKAIAAFANMMKSTVSIDWYEQLSHLAH